MYLCPPTLALSCVVRADTFSWEESSSRRSLRIWREKNAEQKQVEKGKKKKHRWKEEEKEAHTRDPGVSWKENFVIWYQRGETVCRCMYRIEVCCTGGRKDHRDVRWNEIRPWIHPQFVFTTGQWWWINTLLMPMCFTGMWGAVCVVFAKGKTCPHLWMWFLLRLLK